MTAVSPRQFFEKTVNLFPKFILNAHNFKNYEWDLLNSFWDGIWICVRYIQSKISFSQNKTKFVVISNFLLIMSNKCLPQFENLSNKIYLLENLEFAVRSYKITFKRNLNVPKNKVILKMCCYNKIIDNVVVT